MTPGVCCVLADMMEPEPVDVARKATKRAVAQNFDRPWDTRCSIIAHPNRSRLRPRRREWRLLPSGVCRGRNGRISLSLDPTARVKQPAPSREPVIGTGPTPYIGAESTMRLISILAVVLACAACQ